MKPLSAHSHEDDDDEEEEDKLQFKVIFYNYFARQLVDDIVYKTKLFPFPGERGREKENLTLSISLSLSLSFCQNMILDIFHSHHLFSSFIFP